jgi:hypothetical protein
MERSEGKAMRIQCRKSVTFAKPRTENTGKFEAKWLGPYVVTAKTRLGTYHLSNT